MLSHFAMKSMTDEDAQAARQRLADGCDRMKGLLHGLLDSQGRVAEEVHAIRKLGKSLRGGFFLFRLEKSAASEIQAIGRLLSGPRDAVSRQSTWTKLGWAEDPAVAAAIAGLLDVHTHAAARRPPEETVAWCLERVAAARAELDGLPAEDLAERLRGGARRLQRRLAKRCSRMKRRGEEDFHEARKAIKAWLGAAGFLPEGMVETDPLIEEMAEFLGDENDLATLSAWLGGHGFTERFAPGLWESIESARDRLQRKAIKDARRLPASP